MSSVREIMREIRDKLAHPLTLEQQQRTIIQAEQVAHALQASYHGKIRGVILFGGYARGEAVDLSDFDVAVLWYRNRFNPDRLRKRLNASIKSAGPARINFHITPIGPNWLKKLEKYEQHLNAGVLRAIRSEGKSLLR